MPCRWLPAYHSRWAVFGWPWDDHGKDGKYRISHDFTNKKQDPLIVKTMADLEYLDLMVVAFCSKQGYDILGFTLW